MSGASIGGLAEAVRRSVEQYSQRETIASQAVTLTKSESGLKWIAHQLESVAALLGAGEAAGLVTTWPVADDLFSQARELEQAARRDVCDASSVEHFRGAVALAVAHVSSQVKAAWAAHVESLVPDRAGIRELAMAFRSVPGAVSTAHDLVRLLDRVDALALLAPSASQDREVRDAAQVVPRLMSELVGTDESIRRFARLAIAGGAPVSAITPAVNAWLTERGFAQSFRVVPGRPLEGAP